MHAESERPEDKSLVGAKPYFYPNLSDEVAGQLFPQEDWRLVPLLPRNSHADNSHFLGTRAAICICTAFEHAVVTVRCVTSNKKEISGIKSRLDCPYL